VGLACRVRFALDPIAEYLAAFAGAEVSGTDYEAWGQLLKNSSEADGFNIALRLVRQAYGSTLGWPAS